MERESEVEAEQAGFAPLTSICVVINHARVSGDKKDCFNRGKGGGGGGGGEGRRGVEASAGERLPSPRTVPALIGEVVDAAFQVGLETERPSPEGKRRDGV